MSGYRITAALWDRIHHFASFPQTGVSLQQMVLFGQNPSQGTLYKASQFLTEELPIRLAHRAKELDELPHDLSSMPSINKVKNWYCQSFEELINFPRYHPTPEIKKLLYSNSGHKLTHKFPSSTPNPSMLDTEEGLNAFYDNGSANVNGNGNGHLQGRAAKLRIPIERRYYAAAGTPATQWPPEMHAYNNNFTKLLETIKRRHDPTVTTVAQGVLEWKRSQKRSSPHIGLDVQQWLDRFYMSRIGIRFLIGQHIALNTLEPHPDYVGIICTRANVRDIVHEAIENARFVCEEHYGMFNGPPVQLICDPGVTFAYVPGHLSHICFELLKNSLRAVVERFGVAEAVSSPDKLPPIKVIISEGKEDITIKISDEGGGIPRSGVGLVWTYMYTTMANQGIQEDFTDSDFKAPMAGFGYGLPLSRLVGTCEHSFSSLVFPPKPFLKPHIPYKPTSSASKQSALHTIPFCTESESEGVEVERSASTPSSSSSIPIPGTCTCSQLHTKRSSIFSVEDPPLPKTTPLVEDIDSLLTYHLYPVMQYARYFGGDLKLISMEGYGTDVYIHLNRLSSSREPLQ